MEATGSGLTSGSYGITQVLNSPPRATKKPVKRPLVSPGSPSPASKRILVVATVDAERYTAVDITDSIDDGSIIRTRILTKLGIWDIQDQARSLIYETEIGAVAIGQPLSDESLAAMCNERGDSRASLAFIVQRPPPPRSPDKSIFRSQEQPVESDISRDQLRDQPRDQPRVAAQNHQRQQNHSQTPNEPPNPTTHINKSSRMRSQEHRTARLWGVPIESQGDRNGNLHELPPRRVVRPLPSIPTPTSTPSSGTPLGGDSYKDLRPLINEFDELYDYAPAPTAEDEKSSNMKSRRVDEVERSSPLTEHHSEHIETVTKGPSLNNAKRPQKNDAEHHTPPPKSPRPFKWVRGELIGRGTYGSVYLGLSAITGELLAVRQMEIPQGRPDSRLTTIVQALKAESEILRELDHMNIVRYMGIEETLKTINIFMEYVPGGSIANCLRKLGKFSENITKSFTTQIIDGLVYLHSKQLLHRDLKAENVLVDMDGTCKISDFAISKHADEDGFVFTALQGSLFWMAPEVINTRNKGYSTKVDIWSLGCLVLEMWTGTRPWSGSDTFAVMMKLYERKLPPPIPEGFSLTDVAKDFYNNCFTIDPKERPSAAQMQNHPYLQLPPFWEFTGFEEQTLDSPPPSDVSQAPDLALPLDAKVTHDPPIGHTLHIFRRYSSTSETPEEWLDANRIDFQEHVVATTSTWCQCHDWVQNEMIFERVIILLEHETADLALWENVPLWMTWDTLTRLHKFKVIGESLRESCLRNDLQHLKEIVALDVDSICAQLFIILKDPKQYRKLVSLQGDEAQGMVNLMQTLLDLPFLDAIFRSPFMNALLQLSRKTSLYPDVLLQDQVMLEGEDAVAAGQFGDVWKGTFREQQVAVKVLKLYVQSDITKHFKKVLHETLIWRQLRHNHVLPFLCLHHVRNNRARIGLVSPWLENGNAQEFLRRVPDVDRMSLILDIAEGLEYLHSMQPTIVHGDLKAVNILITDTHQACLADFGLSTASDSQVLRLSSFSMGQIGGTSRWTAPELLDGTQLTNNMKGDIYAFACVCYEIFSGKIPFHDILSDYPVILNVIRGHRPLRPSHCEPWNMECEALGLSDSVWGCIEDCWKMDFERRPTTRDILNRLPRDKRRQHRHHSLPLDHLQRRDELWPLLDPV